ncbi:MAG: cysteine desulfurase family protein [Alphaproteobacteria bacterium]
MTPVYLDYNATAPMRPEAIAAWNDAAVQPGNASSVHFFGRQARKRVELARDHVARLIGARATQVVFTGSGTEANNLVLRGSAGREILVSAVEHDSILQTAPGAVRIAVDADGLVRAEAFDLALKQSAAPKLVSVQLANNETGVLQDVAKLAVRAHEAGAWVHCDAVQAVGKVPVNFAALGIDLLSVSAHKMGGPQGVGALVVADPIQLLPVLTGGGQERGRRAGTENVAGIAAFGAAAEAAQHDLAKYAALSQWRDRIEREIMQRVPAARTYGRGVARLPNTVCLGCPGLAAETQVMALDLDGIAVSAGSACSSGKVRASHVLKAMGLTDAEASSAIRISLGWGTQEADIDRFVAAWCTLASRRGAA